MQASIQQHLRERVQYFVAVARQKYPTLLMQDPQVLFFSNRRAAGSANWMQNYVKFNTILAEENKEEFDNTVIHEVAHLVAPRVHGIFIKPHGEEFKSVMAVLGGRPNRTHNYSTENVKSRTRVVKREFEYGCGCAGKVFKLTSIQHNRILQGNTYSCKACRKQIVAI